MNTTDIEVVNRELIGKTIAKVEAEGVNLWVFHFTDGTKKEIWSESDSDSVPFLYLDDEKQEEMHEPHYEPHQGGLDCFRYDFSAKE